MPIETAYKLFFDIMLCAEGMLLILCLLRSIIGPSVADRIVAVNMVGTNTIAIICMLAIRLNESYLTDIALIYAMVSFLAVVLLTKVYMGAYQERKMRKKHKREDDEQ